MANIQKIKNYNLIMKFNCIFIIIWFCLTSCDTPIKDENYKFDKKKLDRIMEFSKNLFSKEQISSTEILEIIRSYSDKIIEDTASNTRLPKANLFISTSTNTYFRIFEKPAGTIVAIGLYVGQNRYNVAEYYNNGQIICKFNVTDDGIRNGPYQCFNEDGTLREKGYFKNNNAIKDSLDSFE